MSKKIIIDAVCNDEIRVATIEDNNLVQFRQFNAFDAPQKGNIYVGRVTRVEQALQAAFVEYDDNKFGFLPMSEICPKYFGQFTLEEQKKASITPNFHRKHNIQDVLKEEDQLLVQVIKDKRGSKGATVSTYMVLAGRYCVFTPYSINSIISKQISKTDDRQKLEKFISTLGIPEESGIIIRASANKRPENEIEKDYRSLTNTWNSLEAKANKVNGVGMIYKEVDIIKKTVRDKYDDRTSALLIEDYNSYKLAKQYAAEFSDQINIKLYKGKKPIFSQYKVEEQVDMLLMSDYVELRSGGHIVINPTEALTAIDVNSGKMTSENSTEETAYKTNLEAAKEAVRQIELRGISGIIVIDFIDMINDQDCYSVAQTVEAEFRKHRSKVQISGISKLGLMEISKQRNSASLIELNHKECHHCSGRGLLVSKETSAHKLMRNLNSECANKDIDEINVYASSEVALYVLNEKRHSIKQLEDNFQVLIYINIDSLLPNMEFAIESRSNKYSRTREKSAPPHTSEELAPPDVPKKQSWIRMLLEKIIS